MESFKQQVQLIPYQILGFISSIILRILFTLSWSTLRDIEHNKIVHSTFMWLFIVPLSAKLFSKLENTISFEISDKLITLDLTMPFSWQALFFSACFFVIGNLMVSFLLPDLIKNFKNFNEFNTSGKTEEHLKEVAGETLKENQESINNLKKLAGIGKAEIKTDSQDGFKNRFDKIYSNVNYGNIWQRGLCTCMYLVGLLFIIDIAYKNLMWVLSSINLIEFKDKLFFSGIIDMVLNAF